MAARIDFDALAREVGRLLSSRGHKLATAESCTGGWVAQVVTSAAGSSDWFDRGFVTYSNEAKYEMLGVRQTTVEAYGAVSEETVREMVDGALRFSAADCALAVSGVAGPGGGTPDKPVGTVCFAWQRRGSASRVLRVHLAGDRRAVRQQAVRLALEGVLDDYR